MFVARIFQKLKDAERQRINKVEELERKADLQLERQLVMATCWSRALLTMPGKLKGTEWDPENSHRIDFSDFMGLLNSNNVQFVEYSNYGQTISGKKVFLNLFCLTLNLWLFAPYFISGRYISACRCFYCGFCLALHNMKFLFEPFA